MFRTIKALKLRTKKLEDLLYGRKLGFQPNK